MRWGLSGVLLALLAGCGPGSSVAPTARSPAPLPCASTTPSDRSATSTRQRFWFYDDAGRLRLSFVDDDGVPAQLEIASYSEDGRERWLRRVRPMGAVEVERQVNDAEGRVVLRELEADGRTAVLERLEWDASGRIVASHGRDVTHLGDGTVARTYAYDDAGRLASETPGVVYEWLEPLRARRVRLDDAGGREVLDLVTVDERQRVVRKVSRVDLTGEPLAWSTFAYDGRDRVVEERAHTLDPVTGQADVQTRRWAYDAFGARIGFAEPARYDCPRDGEERFTGDDGNLVVTGRVGGGVREGTWEVHTRSGSKLRDVSYVDGLPAQVRTWFPSGALYEEGALVEGLRSGTWARYWESGAPRERGSYVDGQRVGVFAQHAEDGSPLPSVTFEPLAAPWAVGWIWEQRAVMTDRMDRDTLQGTHIVTERNFLLRVRPAEVEPAATPIISWRTDGRVQHGTQESWYDTGQLRERASYWSGRPHGVWTTYARDGSLTGDIVRDAGDVVLIGVDVVPVSDADRDRLGLPPGVGVRVTTLFDEAWPAARGGVRVGDVITHLGGLPVADLRTLYDALQEHRSPAVLDALRDGESLRFELTPVGPPPLEAPEGGGLP